MKQVSMINWLFRYGTIFVSLYLSGNAEVKVDRIYKSTDPGNQILQTLTLFC